VRHLRYAKYIVRHRWFVFVACCRMGVPWLGITHDLSKLRWSEWKPYADSFYGPERTPDVQAAFDLAWLLHQNRNKHHWQFWMLPEDDGGTKLIPMPDRYRREMVADWTGAGQAITGRKDWRPWYIANRAIIQLHADTRAWIEGQT